MSFRYHLTIAWLGVARIILKWIIEMNSNVIFLLWLRWWRRRLGSNNDKWYRQRQKKWKIYVRSHLCISVSAYSKWFIIIVIVISRRCDSESARACMPFHTIRVIQSAPLSVEIISEVSLSAPNARDECVPCRCGRSSPQFALLLW